MIFKIKLITVAIAGSLLGGAALAATSAADRSLARGVFGILREQGPLRDFRVRTSFGTWP